MPNYIAFCSIVMMHVFGGRGEVLFAFRRYMKERGVDARR
jgi:hypothetical protein